MRNSLFILLFLLTVTLSCKKKLQDVTCNTGQSFQIIFNGNGSMLPPDVMPGDTVLFQAARPISGQYNYYSYQSQSLAGCIIFWSFGDGATSTELSPSHVYDSSGTYSVQMILNNDFASAYYSKVYIGPEPIYTRVIAGTRQWRRTRIVTDGPTNIKDTSISDTTFAINMVDNKTISIDGTLLHYIPLYSKPDNFQYLSHGSPRCALNFNYNTGTIRCSVSYGWWMEDQFENL